MSLTSLIPVSYTHLDVYKRQAINHGNESIMDMDADDRVAFKQNLHITFLERITDYEKISIPAEFKSISTYGENVDNTNTVSYTHLKGNSQKSYSGNVNVSTTFWDQLYITFGLSGNVSKTKAFNAANPYSYASTTNRAIPCYNEDGSLHFYRTSGGGFYNILHELHNSGNRNTSNSINSNFSIRWVMGHGLTLSSIIGYNYSTSFGESWYTEQSNNIRCV